MEQQNRSHQTKGNEKEQAKLVADQFVSDVIQLAIDQMNRRALNGNNAENILTALKKIQLQDPGKQQRYEKAKRGRKQHSDEDEEVTHL